MELGIITDEVHTDFATACEHIGKWGLPLAEIRNVDGKNVTLLTDGEAASALRSVRRHGLRVSAVASPVFKSPFDEVAPAGMADFSIAGADSVDAQLALLERACVLALRFDTRLVRVFTFLRVPWSHAVVSEVVSRMSLAAAIAQKHDLVLAVENEPACVVGTGAELAEFFSMLDAALPSSLRHHVGALWDPGNALALGEAAPYPDGYAALPKDRLVHVHVKDTTTVGAGFGGFVPPGQGLIDYAGQFAALRRDGYAGSVVLEPHYAPPDTSTTDAALACVTATRRLLAA